MLALLKVLAVPLVGLLRLVIFRGSIGRVGRSIDRIFHLCALACQHFIVGIAHRYGILAFGERIQQHLPVIIGGIRLVHSSAKQEQMVIHIIHILVSGEIVHQTFQRALCQREVLQAFLFQNAGLIQSLGQGIV